MTYRERREARADRLREWAEKRETRAAAVFKANEPFTSDYTFNTQPGHFPQRARVIASEDRAYASLGKAREMASHADSIDAQAAAAIYSDDPDTIEALRARIASLEAEHEQIKSENAAFRTAHRAELKAMTAYQRDQAMPHRGYVLTNLTGNIARNRERLIGLERKAAQS